MTLQETGELCLFIRRTTHAWAKEDNESFKAVVKDWHYCLKDVPYEMAKKSAVEHIAKNNYQPTIADVSKGYREYLEEQKAMRIEYNNIYYAAIANYPAYKDSREERMEFDRITKNSVGKAAKLSNMIVSFVREQEKGKCEFPSLEEWLKGIDSFD